MEAPPCDLIDHAMLSRLAYLPLTAREAKIGQVSGRHLSPHHGSSLEFAEYRRYEPGDDIRRLDWRVYGRSDRYFVKEFEADTNLRCCLAIDGSGSMAYGQKFLFARRLAASLAFLAVQQGDSVGCHFGSEARDEHIPCSRKPAHLREIFAALTEWRPETGRAGFPSSLHQLAERLAQRALLIIFSDLFFEPSELAESLQHLRYRKHELAVFQIIDPSEEDFNFLEPMLFSDLEGDDRLPTEPRAIRETYQKAFADHRAAINTLMEQHQVDYHLARCDEDLKHVLAKFLTGRSRSRSSR